MKTKEKKKASKWKKAQKTKERKWAKKWLLAIVHPKEDNSILQIVTGVDVVRGLIQIGEKWVGPPENVYEIVTSLRKKDWKRDAQFMRNGEDS